MFYQGEFLLFSPFSFTQVLSNFFVNSFSYSLQSFLEIGWTSPPSSVKVQVAEILIFSISQRHANIFLCLGVKWK